MSSSSKIQSCQGNIASPPRHSLSGCAQCDYEGVSQRVRKRDGPAGSQGGTCCPGPHTVVLLVLTSQKLKELSALESQQEMWQYPLPCGAPAAARKPPAAPADKAGALQGSTGLRPLPFMLLVWLLGAELANEACPAFSFQNSDLLSQPFVLTLFF